VTHKLLRALRLDASDTFVFERAATAGEWLVSGSFKFWDHDLTTLSGRTKQAFRSGFLGLTSHGWSTLAVVVEASDDERAAALHALATHLMQAHGAPTLDAAIAAAEDEIAFAESLAQHPVQTLIAVHRSITADGEISEQFRTFHAADAKQAIAQPCSAGAFSVVEDEATESNEVFDLAGTVVTANARQATKP
jgi:hypothetical protein